MPCLLDLTRLFSREGAIRLPVSSSPPDEAFTTDVKDGRLSLDDGKAHGELPFFLSEEEADDHGYTSAHLLVECIGASVFNALCFCYLQSRLASPPAHHLAALLVLVAIPLAIGISAGSACVFGAGEEERELRQGRGPWKKVGCWNGLIGCIAALWPVGYRLVRDQPKWLQLHLAVTLAIVQGLLIQLGTGSPSDEDEAQEGALALPRTSLDLGDDAKGSSSDEGSPFSIARARGLLPWQTAREGRIRLESEEEARDEGDGLVVVVETK